MYCYEVMEEPWSLCVLRPRTGGWAVLRAGVVGRPRELASAWLGGKRTNDFRGPQ